MLVLSLLLESQHCACCHALLGRELAAHDVEGSPALAYCLVCARRALESEASAPACSEVSPLCPACDRLACVCALLAPARELSTTPCERCARPGCIHCAAAMHRLLAAPELGT